MKRNVKSLILKLSLPFCWRVRQFRAGTRRRQARGYGLPHLRLQAGLAAPLESLTIVPRAFGRSRRTRLPVRKPSGAVCIISRNTDAVER